MSSLIRWQPVEDLVAPRRAMRRWRPWRQMRELVEEPLGEFLALDMYETGDNVVIKATMPGVDADNIQVDAVGNTLTIKAETKSEEDVKESNYIYRERRYGKFSRSVTLPHAVDADKVEAEYHDGVLTLTVAKPVEAKPRVIEIKSETS